MKSTTSSNSKTNKITEREYSILQRAFDTFNKQLFGNELKQPLITLKNHANSKSFFVPERFSGRKSEQKTDEISLNLDSFSITTDEEILSNLVREMCSLWNHYNGTPTRPGYHTKSWAKKMVEIGLRPISYDREGSMTGYRVDHEIIDGGAFQRIAQQLLNNGIGFNWQSSTKSNLDLDDENQCTEKKRDLSKIKFTCPECGLNAWAKSTAQFQCLECGKRMVSELELETIGSVAITTELMFLENQENQENQQN